MGLSGSQTPLEGVQHEQPELVTKPVTRMSILTTFGEFHRRAGIVIIAIAWLSLAIVYYNYAGSNSSVSYPFGVSFLFTAAGLTMLAFSIRPCNFVLYRLAGALSVVAIASRALSVIAGTGGDPDAIFIALSQLMSATVLFMLFWWFWQTEVRVWHEYRKERCRLKPDNAPC